MKIKKNIEIEINVFDKLYCNDGNKDSCDFLDSEFTYCNLFPTFEELKIYQNNIHVFKRCQECIDKFGGVE